jgi:hypothetical protein
LYYVCCDDVIVTQFLALFRKNFSV